MNNQDDILFKQKRDEYLVEIRKKKNSDLISAKRTKLTLDIMDPNNGTNNSEHFPLPPITELAASFMKNYNSGSLPGIVSILTKIRIAVSQDYAPPVDDLIRAQIVPYIIQLLKPTLFKEEDLITEALWIVANIASRESDHVNYLMGNDIVQKVLPLLEHPNFHVQENVIWILSNICGESLVYRDQVLKYGIADKIDKFLGKFEGPESIIVCMAWFISNLCRGEPYPAFNDIATFLPYIQYIIKKIDNEEALGHCMWSILYISNSDETNPSIIKEILDMNILPDLLAFLSTKSYRIFPPIIRTLGNLVLGTDKQEQAVLDAGAIQALYPLLTHQVKLIRKETCWAFSNILGGLPSQIKEVFDFGDGKVIDGLFELWHKDDREVQDECLYALTNACEIGRIEEVGALVDRGILETLIDVLRSEPKPEIIKICVQAITEILDEGQSINEFPHPEYNPYFVKLSAYGGLNVLNQLGIGHENREIFDLIEKLFQKFGILM